MIRALILLKAEALAAHFNVTSFQQACFSSWPLLLHLGYVGLVLNFLTNFDGN